MALCQHQRIVEVEWDERIIVYNELETNARETAVAYFNPLHRLPTVTFWRRFFKCRGYMNQTKWKGDERVGEYEGRLKSSWTHLITPTRNFVEVRWRSLFRSTTFGKRWTSYNAPPTSRKCAADRWSLRNFLPCSSHFMVGKAQKSHGARSGLYGGCSNGVPPIHFFKAEHRIQVRSRPMRFLGFSNHEKGAPRQEISKWSTACSTFSRSGWSVVRSESLAKDLHRTSTKFRLGVIKWVHELCKRSS
jgi:hypothetical protein